MIDDLTIIWVQIYGFWVLLLALIAVVSMVFIYEKMEFFTPKECNEIRKAARKKKPMALLANDEGLADLLHAPVAGPEGALETKGTGRTKEHYTGFLPRPLEISKEDLEVADGKDKDKTFKVASYIAKLATKPLFLRSARVPLWVGYRGKAILASVYALASLEILEALVEKLKDDFQSIDVQAIKALFSAQWNESQINAQETDKERIGELKAKKFAGKDSLIMFFAVLIGLVVLTIVLVAAVYYLGGR